MTPTASFAVAQYIDGGRTAASRLLVMTPQFFLTIDVSTGQITFLAQFASLAKVSVDQVCILYCLAMNRFALVEPEEPAF